jgi:hypothetical protein
MALRRTPQLVPTAAPVARARPSQTDGTPSDHWQGSSRCPPSTP